MSPRELTGDEKKRIGEVKTYVLNHLHEKFSIEGLARTAAMGEQKFKDGFFVMYGMNIRDYIHEARMQTAKFLLVNSEKTIKDIAKSCGYMSRQNFSTEYKRFFGVTPGSARNLTPRPSSAIPKPRV